MIFSPLPHCINTNNSEKMKKKKRKKKKKTNKTPRVEESVGALYHDVR